MLLLDRLAEEHILAAQRQGEFDHLSGTGKPLQLDDDSHVPAELRSGYRMLKNAGYLPPELELRREAIALSQLISGLDPEDEKYPQQTKRLRLLELRLHQAGMNTDFLHGDYIGRLHQHFSEEE